MPREEGSSYKVTTTTHASSKGRWKAIAVESALLSFIQVPAIEKCNAIQNIQQREFVYSIWLSGVLRLHLNNPINNAKVKKYSFGIGGFVVIFFVKVPWKAQINFQHSNTGNLLHLIQEFPERKKEKKKKSCK